MNISIQRFQAISRGKYNAWEVKLASETTFGKRSMKPLTRQQVREIPDRNANTINGHVGAGTPLRGLDPRRRRIHRVCSDLTRLPASIPRPRDEARETQKQQTDTLTNQQGLDLVENTIRSRPQDFPLLTKYYLNAE